MKNLILTVTLMIAFGLYACHYVTEPEKIKTAFKEKFPDAKSVRWGNEEKNEWEAEFVMDGKKMSAVFNNDGKWLESEIKVNKNKLPKAVITALNNDYKGYRIIVAEYDETPDYKVYEIRFELDEKNMELVIDDYGTIVKKEIIVEENEENEEAGECEEGEHKGSETDSHSCGNVLFTDDFNIKNCTFSSTGRNAFFILEPGYQLILEGNEEGKTERLEITVLDEVKKIGDIETRVMEEKELVNGEITEISRNFLAFCVETSDIFYFGEEVDLYENGKIKSHESAWHADGNNFKAGILMPGRILLGSRYYQEIAPAMAMDRAEIISTTETVQTPAGIFTNCLKTRESSGLNQEEVEYKFYAPAIGLVKEEDLLLIRH